MRKELSNIQLLRLLAGIFLFLSPFFMHAQDIHFTQFQASTVQLNPALTGLYNGTIRFSAIARNQWATVPVNYNSAKFSVEYNVLTMKNRDKLSVGVLFYYDRAGDSRYSTSCPSFSFAYSKALGSKKNQYLSAGVNLALISRQMDYSLLKFDAQYNGEFYDANAYSFESTGKVTKNVMDIGAGLAYSFFFQKKYSLEMGLSIQHLNQPNYSFKSDKKVTLNSRYTGHLSGSIALTQNFAIMPQFLYQRQDSKQEFVASFLFKNKILSHKKTDMAFYYGPSYRVKDAISIVVGVLWNQWNFGFSYDVNSSGFRKASNTYGAVELSVQYIYSHLIKYKDSKQICPIF